jgi:CRP-like cAMP-binding protein
VPGFAAIIAQFRWGGGSTTVSDDADLAAEAAGASPRLERRKYQAGEKVFGQGDSADCAFIVQKGMVRLYQSVDGHQVEIADIPPGEIFGEMAVLDQGSRSATAIAVEVTTLACVPKEAFLTKLEKSDKFLGALIQLFIRNIRNSPRFFLRRPRSFRDHVKQMRMFSWNMRRFAGRIDSPDTADDLLDVLDRLDILLIDLNDVADQCNDKRHDLLTEEDLTGNGFAEVIGTEGQRKI